WGYKRWTMDPMSSHVPSRLPNDRSASSLADVPTPAVVIDRARMEANLDRGARLAAAAKVTLRPHIKTHKSLKIALEEEARGAGGVTASKPEEALVFLRSGLGSLTVAYPLVERAKIARLLHEAAQRGAELTLIADSRFGVQALAEAVGEVGSTASVMLK